MSNVFVLDEARRENRRRRKRIRRVIGIILLLLALYYVIGATCFFWFPGPTGDVGSTDISSYLADFEGPERVMLIENNVDALTHRLRLILEAEREIMLSTYQFKTGGAADALGLALLDAADRGVKVSILVDGLSGVLHLEGEDYFRALDAHPNIEFRIYNRFSFVCPWSFNGRLHDKIFAVDDLAYIVGGRNTCDRFLGDFGADDENLDREVLVYNQKHGEECEASIFDIRAYFLSIWDGEYTENLNRGGADFAPEKVAAEYARIRESGAENQVARSDDFDAWCRSVTQPTDKITMISGETHNKGKDPVVWREMKRLMLSAEEKVIIQSPYVVLSSGMYDDMREVAARVPTVFVTNSINNTDNRFTPADYLYHQDEILETGVSIYEFEGIRPTHAKTILIDDSLVLLGSFNVDLRSAYMSTELMIAIDSEALSEIVTADIDMLSSDLKLVEEGNKVGDVAKELPFGRRIFFYILGLLVQPFRIEL